MFAAAMSARTAATCWYFFFGPDPGRIARA